LHRIRNSGHSRTGEVANVYIVPAVLGAIATVHLRTLAWKNYRWLGSESSTGGYRGTHEGDDSPCRVAHQAGATMHIRCPTTGNEPGSRRCEVGIPMTTKRPTPQTCQANLLSNRARNPSATSVNKMERPRTGPRSVSVSRESTVANSPSARYDSRRRNGPELPF
jgi:hypothetical protein